MRLTRVRSIFFVFVIISFYACNVNSSIMMRTGKNYEYSTPPSEKSTGYKITPHDVIDFRLFTNDGTSLVDLTAINEAGSGGSANTTSFSYLVEFDGFSKLPVIGRVELKGKTIREAEDFLEEQYKKYYIKPFALLKVTNKRITIFPGGSIGAQTVTLLNENTTIIEVFGKVGGLNADAKSYRIKLIRGDLKNPDVYLFDFSKIEGIQQADFVLQANDIIYIEPRKNIAKKVIGEVGPIISFIVSITTLILVINNLK